MTQKHTKSRLIAHKYIYPHINTAYLPVSGILLGTWPAISFVVITGANEKDTILKHTHKNSQKAG